MTKRPEVILGIFVICQFVTQNNKTTQNYSRNIVIIRWFVSQNIRTTQNYSRNAVIICWFVPQNNKTTRNYIRVIVRNSLFFFEELTYRFWVRKWVILGKPKIWLIFLENLKKSFPPAAVLNT